MSAPSAGFREHALDRACTSNNGGFNRYPITSSNPFFTGCEYAILRHSCDDRFGKMLFDGRERAIYDQKGKKDR
jgi:hypothetical protein